MRGGACAGCDRDVWTSAVAQRDDKDQGIAAGQRFLLWPRPWSLYAQTWTPTGHTVGIAYCPDCAPAFGELGPEIKELGRTAVVGYETAKGRYTAWYTEDHGAFLRAWLADALGYDEAMLTATMTMWEQDRA